MLKSQFLFIIALLTSTFISPNSKAEEIIKVEVSKSIYGAGEILTNCQVGSKSQKCKMDTGAPYSLSTNTDLNTESNLINKINYYGISGKPEHCNFVETHQPMNIGGSDFNNRGMLICERAEEKGLLGLNHLLEKPFLLNMKEESLVIGPNSVSSNLNDYLTDSNDHIFVKIKIFKGKKEHEIIAMLDTGAGITVASKDLLKSHPEFLVDLSQKGAGLKDTNNVELETVLGFLNGLQIANKKVIIPYVMFIDFSVLQAQTGLDVDMVIGVNVLRELNSIYIDPIHKHWTAD